MGGGEQLPCGDGDDFQPALAHLYRLVDTASYGPQGPAPSRLIADYDRVHEGLERIQVQKSLAVKTAAHTELMQGMGQAASRYKDLEIATQGFVDRAEALVEGLTSLVKPLEPALRFNAPGAKSAVLLAASRLQSLGTVLEGLSAAHSATAHDIDKMAIRAHAVTKNPKKADLGVEAAPILGGAATASLLVLLRGALGPLGAVAAIGAGVLGAHGLAHNIVYPEVEKAFTKLGLLLDQVSGMIHSKAVALTGLAYDLNCSSAQLQAVVDVAPDGSDETARLVHEGLTACSEALVAIALRCAGCCKYQTSAFLALEG